MENEALPKSKINIALLSSSLYVGFSLIANVLSTKIAVLPFTGLAIDAGTVIYPFTFTLRDFVHKTWGKKQSRQVIIFAALLNLIMFALFWLGARLAPDPTWPFQDAYEKILLPVGRIVLASIIAQVIAELLDTEVFSIIYKKWNDLLAVFGSNLVGAHRGQRYLLAHRLPRRASLQYSPADNPLEHHHQIRDERHLCAVYQTRSPNRQVRGYIKSYEARAQSARASC